MWKEEHVFKIGNAKLYFLPVIKGLVSEEAKVSEGFNIAKPDCVCISISEEDLDIYQRIITGSAEFENVPSTYDKIYIKNLSRFGTVKMPAPCFIKSIELANQLKISVIPLDMNDETFTKAYCEYITYLQLVRYSMRAKKIAKREFKTDTAEEFVLLWDSLMTDLEGFRKLEELREETMSKNLIKLTEKYTRLLVIIELERFSGLLNKCGFKISVER